MHAGTPAGKVVEEQRFIEPAPLRLGERISIEPVIRGLQPAKERPMWLLTNRDLATLIARSGALLKQQEDARYCWRAWRAVARGHINARCSVTAFEHRSGCVHDILFQRQRAFGAGTEQPRPMLCEKFRLTSVYPQSLENRHPVAEPTIAQGNVLGRGKYLTIPKPAEE